MYSGIKNVKVNNRNRSTSYFTKRCSSNTNTFTRIKHIEEVKQLKLKQTPLCVSAASWIIVTPNEQETVKTGFSLNIRREKKNGQRQNAIRIAKSPLGNNPLKCCYMYGNRWSKQREIASLTKIMTCYTVLKLIDKHNLHKHMTLITISKKASEEVGTTAYLQDGHILSVWDLLHALMLPSGNDAAIALSEYFGNFLIAEDEKSNKSKIFHSRAMNATSTSKDITNTDNDSYTIFPEIKSRQEKEFSSDSNRRDTSNYCKNKGYYCDVEGSYSLGIKGCSTSYSESFCSNKENFISFFRDSKSITRFIKEMNSNAKILKLNNTHFDSPHGLANFNNVSTAYDMAQLCYHCVKNIDFNRITRTKSYVCKSRNKYGVQLDKVITKDYSWTNTNKLLNEGFIGIKTGVTYPAGPCFAAYLKSKGRSFIVVLLNCGSLEQRFSDAKNVIEHCHLKICCGQTSDMKPADTKSINDKESLTDSFNMSQIDTVDSQKDIDSTSTDKDRLDEDFFKTCTENLQNLDEEGSPTLSSPICSWRKSIQIELSQASK